MVICIILCVLPLTSAMVLTLILQEKDANNGIESLIYYGDGADISDYPFFAALNNCGAAIISSFWALTAAHCVDHKHHDTLWVGGETYPTSKTVKIDHTIAHPNYNKDEVLDDIALIKLSKPLEFSNKVQPVLPPDSKELKNVKAEEYEFIGRGSSETFTYIEHLQRSKMDVFSVSECYRHYHPQRYLRDKTLLERDQKVICTVRENNLPGICDGDSGSPLVLGNVLIGLGSYMIAKDRSCDAPDSYLVNVKHYLPWIKNITELD